MSERNATWRFCPKCKSYRYTFKPQERYGKCQDCGYEWQDVVAQETSKP